MKTVFAKLAAFTMMLMMLVALGCNSPKDKIIGKWGDKDTNFEFLKDGTVVVTNGGQSGSGKWSIMDDGRLRLDVSSPLGGNKTVLMKFTVTDSGLTFTDENNKSETSPKMK